jgi:hypothetical protein
VTTGVQETWRREAPAAGEGQSSIKRELVQGNLEEGQACQVEGHSSTPSYHPSISILSRLSHKRVMYVIVALPTTTCRTSSSAPEGQRRAQRVRCCWLRPCVGMPTPDPAGTRAGGAQGWEGGGVEMMQLHIRHAFCWKVATRRLLFHRSLDCKTPTGALDLHRSPGSCAGRYILCSRGQGRTGGCRTGRPPEQPPQRGRAQGAHSSVCMWINGSQVSR